MATASFSAREGVPDRFCTIRKLASVSRITLFLFKFFRKGAPI